MAARIPGITPSDVAIVGLYVHKSERETASDADAVGFRAGQTSIGA